MGHYFELVPVVDGHVQRCWLDGIPDVVHVGCGGCSWLGPALALPAEVRRRLAGDLPDDLFDEAYEQWQDLHAEALIGDLLNGLDLPVAEPVSPELNPV